MKAIDKAIKTCDSDSTNIDQAIKLLNNAMNKMYSVKNDEAKNIADEIRKIANRAGNLYDEFR